MIKNKKILKTKHGEISLPSFMPDATYGSIKSITFEDAKSCGVKEIVTTTLHIEQNIGSNRIKEMGGIHKYFNWDRPILTDSGGWQVFSLINSKSGYSKNAISDLGCTFVNPNTNKSSLLTPENSIQIQDNLGSDILTVLDHPILINSTLKERRESVKLNTKWAKRSLKKFKELDNAKLLGCVIQGANDFELRKQSASELLELDFDIFNYGGVPLTSGETWRNDNYTGFYHEMLEYVSNLIPENKIKYAMGVGQPEDIAYCVEKGWDLFDTVLPTRNARHGYIYVSEGNGDVNRGYKNLKYDVMHIKSKRYEDDLNPIDSTCKCEACSNYSRSYIRHLLRLKESSALRLLTIHNLTFYSNWMKLLNTSLSSN